MAVRLRRLKKKYGKKLDIAWHSFPLRPQEEKGRRFNAHSTESWTNAGKSEKTIQFKFWDENTDLPSCSMPALEAAKCAALQGADAFERFHYLVFKAYFEEARDISQRPVLLEVAQAAGLDMDRFTADLEAGAQNTAVLADFQEGGTTVKVTSVPTMIFSDEHGSIRVVGDVPEKQYRRLIEWFLAT
ncbi:MAG: DsbA family protein [Chloroflexi bacterium]|nr:DsbA family protein [Chloroflexota bacterium]